MTPKTGAQRQADYKARRIKAGLRLVPPIWAYPEAHGAIKAHAKLLNRRHVRQAKDETK
jgi:hypothetical protein